MNIAEIGRLKGALCGFERAALVRAQGCNLKCVYCAYAAARRSGEVEGRHEWRYCRLWLKKRIGQLDAVVFSGGEPTLQEALPDWMAEVRGMGLGVALETNGTRPDRLRALLDQGLVDFVAMDIKAPLPNYPFVAGCRVDVEAIRASIWSIKQSGVRHEFRTTVVPGLHTARELRVIAELVHGSACFVVQDFLSENPCRAEYRGRPAFPHKPLEALRGDIEKRVKAYEIRHSERAVPMPVGGRGRALVRR